MKNGAFEYLPEGNKWSYGRPAIKVGCEGGYLLAFQSGDPGIYDEISVNFVSDEGRLIQIATIGRDEYDSDNISDAFKDYQPMHVYAYDGISEDVETVQYVTINEDSLWYEK